MEPWRYSETVTLTSIGGQPLYSEYITTWPNCPDVSDILSGNIAITLSSQEDCQLWGQGDRKVTKVGRKVQDWFQRGNCLRAQFWLFLSVCWDSFLTTNAKFLPILLQLCRRLWIHHPITRSTWVWLLPCSSGYFPDVLFLQQFPSPLIVTNLAIEQLLLQHIPTNYIWQHTL